MNGVNVCAIEWRSRCIGQRNSIFYADKLICNGEMNQGSLLLPFLSSVHCRPTRT